MTHTHQMETDTTTEEREVLLQRTDQAIAVGNRHDMQAAYDQLTEHAAMYEGDEAMPLIKEYLAKLNAALESTGNPT